MTKCRRAQHCRYRRRLTLIIEKTLINSMPLQCNAAATRYDWNSTALRHTACHQPYAAHDNIYVSWIATFVWEIILCWCCNVRTQSHNELITFCVISIPLISNDTPSLHSSLRTFGQIGLCRMHNLTQWHKRYRTLSDYIERSTVRPDNHIDNGLKAKLFHDLMTTISRYLYCCPLSDVDAELVVCHSNSTNSSLFFIRFIHCAKDLFAKAETLKVNARRKGRKAFSHK